MVASICRPGREANGKLCKFVRGSGKGQKKTGSRGLDTVLEEKMCNQLSVKCL